MTKWVCVTKNFKNYIYGKIYEGDLRGDLLNVPNDFGWFDKPSLYYIEEVTNYKFSTKRHGVPNKRIYHFITLEEWRENLLEQILND